MNGVAAKLAGFAAVLALVFGGALALGAAAGPVVGVAAQEDPAVGAPSDAAGGHGETGAHDMTGDERAADPAQGGHADHASGATPVAKGLAVSQDGYTLAPVTTNLPAGVEQAFRFVVAGPDGRPVTEYTEEHDKDLHLIVVRRDLSGFQHVHPTMAPDGTWSIPLTLPAAGDYRAFADFVPAGGEGLTLGVDLRAAGDYAPAPLPAPSRTAEVAGYTVELAGDLRPGEASDLTLSVSRDGEPVTDLDPYLGAYGHLVALRDGDLAYLHVHPHGEPGDGTTTAGPAIDFTAEVPSAGTYRLYLDFSHGGVVRTAAFTVTAGTHTLTSAPAATEPTPSPAHDADGHSHE